MSKRYLPCGHLDLGPIRPWQCVCEWGRYRRRRARELAQDDQGRLFP